MSKINNFRDFATEHEWNYKDEIVAYYITMLKAKHTKFDRDVSSVKETEFSWDDVSDDLQKNLTMTLDEISEDMIGCSRGAMIANVAVIEFLITDVDKGFTGPNKYQKEVIEVFEGTPLKEMELQAGAVLDEIFLDKDRLSRNYKKKELRIENKMLKKFQKYNKDKAKSEVESDLKKAKISDKSKPLSDFRLDIEVEVGEEINHPKFGHGKVLSVDNGISEVDFGGTVKKLANKFVDKFKVNNVNESLDKYLNKEVDLAKIVDHNTKLKLMGQYHLYDDELVGGLVKDEDGYYVETSNFDYHLSDKEEKELLKIIN